jgi:hypothetical protein
MHDSFSASFERPRVRHLLVYLLIVVNFQSWLDPFIIITGCRARSRASCGCCSHAAPR